jgi:MFS family permease
MLTVVLPVYVREVLAEDAQAYGLLVGVLAVGMLAGSLAVGALRWRWTLGRSLAAAQVAAGCSVLGLAVSPPLGAAAAILGLTGLLASPLTIWAQTIRMRLIPPELRGRVFSLLRTFMQSMPPIGALIAGSLLVGTDLAPTVVLVSALIAVPGAIGLVHSALAPAAVGEAVPDRPRTADAPV